MTAMVTNSAHPRLLAAWKLVMLIHRELGELRFMYNPSRLSLFDRRTYLLDFRREGYDLLAKQYRCDEVYKLFHAFCVDHLVPLCIKTTAIDETDEYSGKNKIPADVKQKILDDYETFNETSVRTLLEKLADIVNDKHKKED